MAELAPPHYRRPSVGMESLAGTATDRRAFHRHHFIPCRGGISATARIATAPFSLCRRVNLREVFAIAYARNPIIKRDARRARLSDAGGMGNARSDLAFLAAARRDQLPRRIRPRVADIAAHGGSAPHFRAGLHQRLQWRARSRSARSARWSFVRASHVPSHSDE